MRPARTAPFALIAALTLLGCANNPAMDEPTPRAESQNKDGWVYLLRLTRPNLLENASEAELAAFRGHANYLQDLTRKGVVIVAGPVTDELAMGIVVFEAPDEPAARDIMLGDPGVSGGVFTAELHPMRLSLVRDRDRPAP
ncbi:MAG: YciI family protein [Phycisphaerales bacterium]